MEEVKVPTPSQSTQELKVPEGVDLAELSELSGEKGLRRTKYSVPILKFNGNTGKFTLLRQDSSGSFVATIVKKEKLSGVVLKIRRIFTAFAKSQAGEGISYFSNEHNTWRDPLVLFERKKDAPKPKMIDEGTREEVKGRWNELKLRQYLYMLYDGEVVKFGVQGGNLGPLFEYLKSFVDGHHVFQYETDIKFHKEENDAGMAYYRLDFERGKTSDLVAVAKNIKEVSTALDAQDKAFEEQGKLVSEGVNGPSELPEFKAEETEAKPGTEAELPLPPPPPAPSEDDEEIKVEDIPM